MNYSFIDVYNIVGGNILLNENDIVLHNVIYDTRKSSYPGHSIFFAFKGGINDGHNYINEAYKLGVRNFIVSKKISTQGLPGANILLVNSGLYALQKLAAHHRQKFDIPVIAITGSNGKTIVKEWLGKALTSKYKVYKSPKSYNSQLGVALSILKLSPSDELAIIEAGISQKHEMSLLEKMIKPTIGIFTNIGDAHSSGFESIAEKAKEKMVLFKHANVLIFGAEHELLQKTVTQEYNGKTFTWSSHQNATLSITKVVRGLSGAEVSLKYKDMSFVVETSFKSLEYLENLYNVISCMLLLGYSTEEIKKQTLQLDSIENRLELRAGINNNLLINDSYSLDMASLQLALEFQDMHAEDKKKVLILSDFDQQKQKSELYVQLNKLLQEKVIDKCYIIGASKKHLEFLNPGFLKPYSSVETFIQDSDYESITNSCILIKGARKFKLEQIFHKLSKQNHQTVLESKFAALDHNLNVYKSYLKKETKLMAVIKAEAYGTGIHRIAKYLEQKKLNYLAVAIIDEAIQIRQAGVDLPIMVFNVQESQIEALWQYKLEPEVYSESLLDKLIQKAEVLKENLPIHIKIDSGMKRLGFECSEAENLASKLQNQKYLIVKSVFSHLSSSENRQHDDFTLEQINKYNQACDTIQDKISYSFLKHILNTAGIIRFGEHQYDMVRIGLGLYGIDETRQIKSKLEKVHALRARVLQIKHLKKGETTGYSRSGLVDKDSTIAIISIGYADGLMRLCGNGNYSMLIRSIPFPTIGNICMDVSMLDITDHPEVEVGDDVIVFDESHPIEVLATACQTISYEIISRIAPRVKRIYTYT